MTKDNNIATPLYGAAINGCKDTVELLLRNRANVNAKGGSYVYSFCSGITREDYTPLHLAVASGYQNAIKLLLKYGANPLLESSKGGNTTISLWFYFYFITILFTRM